MRKLLAIAIMASAVVFVSACAWALPVTSGLTGVSLSIPTVKTLVDADNLFWYEFTVYNQTSSNEPAGAIDTNWDVLISQFRIYGTDLQVNPVSQRAADGWEWTGQGWNNGKIFYKDDVTGCAYQAPPMIAPGGALGGFKLGFNELLTMPPAAFSFQTHVLAIDEGQRGPLYVFTGATPSYGKTWWDTPTIHGGGGDDDGHPAVPDASATLLGALGMLGPIGYALKRRA